MKTMRSYAAGFEFRCRAFRFGPHLILGFSFSPFYSPRSLDPPNFNEHVSFQPGSPVTPSPRPPPCFSQLYHILLSSFPASGSPSVAVTRSRAPPLPDCTLVGLHLLPYPLLTCWLRLSSFKLILTFPLVSCPPRVPPLTRPPLPL